MPPAQRQTKRWRWALAGLKKTFEGTVTFLGVNSSLDQDLVSAALSEVQMTFAGFAGEDHGGLTRAACSRLRNVHPQGTPLKNQRQLTVLSVEEMAETAATMGIDTGIQPEWVGANLVLSGIPSLSRCPRFAAAVPDGGTIIVDLENAPCKFPQRSSTPTIRARASPIRQQPRASAVSPPLSSVKARSVWATILRSFSRRKKSTRPSDLPYNATTRLALIRISAAGKLSVPRIQFSDERAPLEPQISDRNQD